MVMSAQSSGLSSHADTTPVAPPRRCRNKDAYSNTATPSTLAAWVSTHPRRVNRSASETTTTTTPSNNHSGSVKTVSLERTRSKGLPPSPIVHQPIRKCRTISAATIPSIPTKRTSQLSVQNVLDFNTEPIPNLPEKRIPRLPPKKKKQASNLNSGILNPLDKKDPIEENPTPNINEPTVPDYEDIKLAIPEPIKVTQRKDSKTCCNSLPKTFVLEVIEESSPQNLSLLNHFNTIPKLPPHGPVIPPKARNQLNGKDVPPIPRKAHCSHKPSELSCFTTSSSRYLDLSSMTNIRPSLPSVSSTEGRKTTSKTENSESSLLADDTNDMDLLHDDSYEPDFGHLVLLQGGVEAIHAALNARKKQRSAQKRAVTVSERSQLTLETDSKLDDAGYEVPASEDKNSSNDSDPTYEEVTFRCGEGNHKTEVEGRCCGNPNDFFELIAAAFRSSCCVCTCKPKATSYRFTKGSTWDWHPSEIPKSTKGSRSSDYVSRVRTNKKC